MVDGSTVRAVAEKVGTSEYCLFEFKCSKFQPLKLQEVFSLPIGAQLHF